MAIANPPHANFLYGFNDSGAVVSSPALNATYSHFSSGVAWYAKFVAPATQIAGTLTVYAFAKVTTGSPTFQLRVYAGPTGVMDDDRPNSVDTDRISSPSTLSLTSADDDTWVALTGTCSLTAGKEYWAVITNTHGTAASNHSTFQCRPIVEGLSGSAYTGYAQRVGYTSDGFASNGTAWSTGAVVVKFAGGEIIGNPYTTASSASSNSNDRGIRVSLAEDVVVVGFNMNAIASANISGMEVNLASDGSNLRQVLEDDQKNGVTSVSCCMFEPLTLTGGVEYDFVTTWGLSTTAGIFKTMGEAEGSLPADVLACRGQGWASLEGSTDPSVTPYTVDTSQIIQFAIMLDDNPAIAGGGGGGCKLAGAGGGLVG